MKRSKAIFTSAQIAVVAVCTVSCCAWVVDELESEADAIVVDLVCWGGGSTEVRFVRVRLGRGDLRSRWPFQ